MSCKVTSGKTSTSPPGFPDLTKFLDFWERNLEGKLHRVRVASAQLIKPAEFGFASGLYQLH